MLKGEEANLLRNTLSTAMHNHGVVIKDKTFSPMTLWAYCHGIGSKLEGNRIKMNLVFYKDIEQQDKTIKNHIILEAVKETKEIAHALLGRPLEDSDITYCFDPVARAESMRGEQWLEKVKSTLNQSARHER